MINNARSSRLIILTCLGLCLLFAFLFDLSLLWNIKRTINDDAWVALYEPSKFAAGVAKEQGRFQFYVGAWLWSSVLNLDQSQLYNYLHYGSLFLAHGLFFLTVILYLGSTVGVWTALFYISSLMIYWDHSLLTAMPLWQFLCISSGLLALVVLKVTRIQRPWQVLVCLGLLLFGCFGHEYQPFIFAAAFLMCWASVAGPLPVDKLIKSRGTVVSAVMLVVFLAVYFVYRKLNPTTYDGNKIGNLTDIVLLKTLFHFSLSSSSFYHVLFHHYAVSLIDSLPGRISQLRPLPLKATLLSFAAWEICSKALFIGLGFLLFHGALDTGARLSRRQKIFATLLALFVTLFPNFLLAITEKYQHWYRAGVRIYSYTSISHFGMALLSGIWMSVLLNRLRNRKSQILVSAIAGFMLIAASAISYGSNQVVSESLKRNESRWVFQKLLSNETFQVASSQDDYAYVLAPRLWRSYGFEFPVKPEEYWEAYAFKRFGKKIKFLPRLEQIPVGKVFYFADFSYLSECRANLAWASPAFVKRQGMTLDDLKVHEIRIRSQEPLRYFFINYAGANGSSRAEIVDKISVSSDEGIVAAFDGTSPASSILLSCWPLAISQP